MSPQSSTNHFKVSITLALLVLRLDQCLVAGTTSCSQLCHYVPWARDADCSRRHLDQVPIECVGSKVLNLNKNNITVVPTGVFSGFEHLKYLQMLENNIQTVSANAFAGAQKLKSVNLVQNYLSGLPAATFNDTSGLRWVYLSKNRITFIEPGVFQESPQIQILYLDNNWLPSLQVDIFRGLSVLQRLLLGDNMLQGLPDGVFRDTIELNYLDLSRNRLQTLPVDTFSGLGKLKTVKLSGNRLVALPPHAFSRIPITILDISGNQLQTLPWEEADFDGIDEIEGAGNPWVCDCRLEPFRVTMVMLSGGVDSTVICDGPSYIEHTDIVTHLTLCPDPTPTPKTTTPNKALKNTNTNMKLVNVQSTDGVVHSNGDDASLKIALYFVAAFTVVALNCLGIYILIAYYIIPKRKENKKACADVTATPNEIKIKTNAVENVYSV